jgi:hypothetical protein
MASPVKTSGRSTSTAAIGIERPPANRRASHAAAAHAAAYVAQRAMTSSFRVEGF